MGSGLAPTARFQKVRQLRDIRGDPPRLVARQAPHRVPPRLLVREIEVAERLPVGVLDAE